LPYLNIICITEIFIINKIKHLIRNTRIFKKVFNIQIKVKHNKSTGTKSPLEKQGNA